MSSVKTENQIMNGNKIKAVQAFKCLGFIYKNSGTSETEIDKKNI